MVEGGWGVVTDLAEPLERLVLLLHRDKTRGVPTVEAECDVASLEAPCVPEDPTRFADPRSIGDQGQRACIDAGLELERDALRALVMLLVLGLDALRGGQVEKEEQEAPHDRIRPRARFLTDFPRSRERNKVVVRSGGPAQEPHASRWFTHTLTPHTSLSSFIEPKKHEKCRSSGPELAGLPDAHSLALHTKSPSIIAPADAPRCWRLRPRWR